MITLLFAIIFSNIALANWECTLGGNIIPHGVRAGQVCDSGCCVICVGSYSVECKQSPLCFCTDEPQPQCNTEADTDCDGTISNLELAAYANLWYTDSGISNLNLAMAAQAWYGR